AVRLPVHGGVVHHDDLAVAGHAHVELEHVGARAHRLAEGVHRVGRELVLTALMGDVGRRLRLDPAVGGLGRGGRDGSEAERERDQENAAHGRAGYLAVRGVYGITSTKASWSSAPPSSRGWIVGLVESPMNERHSVGVSGELTLRL